jgi:hypothetical protein
VVEGTNSKQICTWDRYEHDLPLDEFSRGAKQKNLSAFAQAIREGRFSPGQTKDLKSESVCATLDFVAQTYKLAVEQIPGSTRTESLLSFYNDSYTDTHQQTVQKPPR